MGVVSLHLGITGEKSVVNTCGKRTCLKYFGMFELHDGDFQDMECEGRDTGDTSLTFLHQPDSNRKLE